MNRFSQFFRNLKIRSKLLGGYTLIFTAAILIGGGVIFQKVRTTIETHIESELTNATVTILNMVKTAASTSIKNHLRAVAEKNRDIVHRIHADFQQGSMTEAAAKDLCRKILFSQTIGRTGYIFCVNSTGIAIEHPNPGIAGKGFMNRRFVRDMIRLKTGYLEYDWKNPEDKGMKPKAMYMVYFEPWDWIIAVSSYREEFKKLIKISDFRDSILSLRFGKSGYAYIKDSRGNLIVHPFLSGNYYDAVDEDGNYFIRDICEKKNGKAVYTWKNPGEKAAREKMVIFNYLPEYDWIICSTSYLDKLYAPLQTVRNIILIIVLLISILVFATSLWINSSVILPLQSLMKRLDMGASGNFNIRMPVRSTDEIGQLAGYFNRFMDKLDIYSKTLESEINQHKQTEQALGASEEKYRTILEQMAEGYFEVDRKGNFTFCNRAMETILGIGKKRSTRGNIGTHLNPENQNKLKQIFADVEKTGAVRQVTDLEMVKADGAICSVETSVSARRDPDDTPKGFSGVLRDVSERKKSEQALRLSEEMFSKAFKSSPSGMFIAALKDGRIINVNDSFLTITEYSLFEIIGKELLAIRFFHCREGGRKLFREIIHKDPVKNREITFMTAKGEKRTGIISMEQVNLWGEPCMLGTIEDMTDARRLEREILTISERERQKIAMDLHDDLCPQLIGIEVMTKMLQQRLSEKAAGYPVTGEAESAGRIRALILDAIEKTRGLSRGLSPVNLTNRGFDASLEELTAYVRDVFSISCALTCDMSPPFEDDTVATHAYYIVHEAVHNAIKHSKADRIRIRLTNQNGTVTLMIRDNGIGLDRPGKTPGMGIRIMSYRAARIGASLEFENAPEGGTLVRLELGKT